MLEISSNLKLDMATIAKSFGEFHGNEDEDVISWINNCKSISKLTSLPDDLFLFSLVVALRGRARLWFTSVSSESQDWTLEIFLTKLKTRFGASEHNKKILERFQQIKIVSSRIEFKELIDLSIEIFNRGMINIVGLYEQFISRLPHSVRATVSLQAKNSKSWEEVTTISNQMIWIAFPDIEPNAQLSLTSAPIRSFFPKKNFKMKSPTPSYNQSNKYCPFHKSRTHDAKECHTIKQMEEAGWKREGKPIASNTNLIQEVDPEEDNKEFSFYLNSTFSSSNKNPFYSNIKLSNETEHACLIDTGADFSVINKEQVPNNLIIQPSAIKIKSVSNNSLNVIGEIQGLEATVDGTNINIDAIVTENLPNFIIIGANSIMSNPFIFNKILLLSQNNINC
jgi:hypothetical protein